MKDVPQESQPTAVTLGSKQVGEVRARWAWTEPVVWTERMLTALEMGVKGGVWFSLVDKVYSKRSLLASWNRVRENAGSGGVDRQTIEQFGERAEQELDRLSNRLQEGTYQPLPVRRTWIPKADGGRRPLGIPTIRDRIVQGALRNVLEPIFEEEFCDCSYGFRPGRGAKDALRRVDGLLKSGYRYVVDADIKSYFDTIGHDRLMQLIESRVADGRLLSLIRAFLKQGVLEGMTEWTPTRGSPQGAVISPLLSNIYLHPFDNHMQEAEQEMIRYADDFVVLCRTAEEAEAALGLVRQWMQAAGLELHAAKTRIADMDAGDDFQFLGYVFRQGRRWPRKSSVKKFKDAIRRKTKRTDGRDLKTIIKSINYTSGGWFAYFKHSHRGIFRSLDGWIRMRLRSIQRRRAKLTGRGRGQDHQRWPNAYFAAFGFFSMQEAHALACQSLRVHQPESRVREIRTHGSEGGGTRKRN